MWLVLGPKGKRIPFFVTDEKTIRGFGVRLLALNKIENKGRHFRSGDKVMKRRPLVCSHCLTQRQGELDDKGANPFQQDDNGS